MIRYATIGTNFVTRWFVEAAASCENLTYQAVYSRNRETGESFAKEFGAPTVYTDLEELARAKDIDGVYIASPNSLHYEQSLLLMRHGKHILCEKAIASNSRELKHMVDTAKAHGVVLLEAMRPAFDPGLFAIEREMKKLGVIRRVSFQYGKISSRYGRFKSGIIENAFNPFFSNGALMDIGVYCVHPLVKLFGMPKTIEAEAVMLPSGVDGAGTIVAGYGDMMAELLYSKITDNRVPGQIQGEDGTMVIYDIPHPNNLLIYHSGGEIEEIIIEKEENNMVYEIREWCRLIETGGLGEEHQHHSVISMKIMDEVRRQIGLEFPADSHKNTTERL